MSVSGDCFGLCPEVLFAHEKDLDAVIEQRCSFLSMSVPCEVFLGSFSNLAYDTSVKFNPLS